MVAVDTIYKHFIGCRVGNSIPIDLRHRSLIGTTQDDPFDDWVEDKLKVGLGDDFEVFHSGKLQTPDLIVRSKKDNSIIGIEVKKISQKSNGADGRGLTLDYNSCLPCGQTLVKVNDDTIIIPCFYLFALLNQDNTSIVTLLLIDGDFLNFDFDLHKESKVSNFTEYNHGPYGEGSVRHRKMYTYPNPLNSKISHFHLKFLMIAKKFDLENIGLDYNVRACIDRTDVRGNTFKYLLRNDLETVNLQDQVCQDQLLILANVFDDCKRRESRERSPSIVSIPRSLS
ncbi:hypothetical protein KBZ15_12930 [Cyanobium sp. BA20m-p-22]|uniref:hypothetical protein n=1 Tax=Cyanobium sp. BA20m-p-22 TaxID=2823704 RepID=UPI0020CE3526|nr:hypothetical protein [Cyanobium sp. BA20m-p-22]MCP9910794.1 hypothetical protein [Cyanobium sp. BA20m-p-22]